MQHARGDFLGSHLVERADDRFRLAHGLVVWTSVDVPAAVEVVGIAQAGGGGGEFMTWDCPPDSRVMMQLSIPL